MSDDLSKLKVSELKARLVALNEPTSGLKHEMVARLEAAVAKQPATAPTAALPPPTTAEQHAFLDHAKQFEFDQGWPLARPARTHRPTY